jgi:hypothetical protein
MQVAPVPASVVVGDDMIHVMTMKLGLRRKFNGGYCFKLGRTVLIYLADACVSYKFDRMILDYGFYPYIIALLPMTTYEGGSEIILYTQMPLVV